MTSEIKPEDVKLPEPTRYCWTYDGMEPDEDGTYVDAQAAADQVRAAVLEAKAQERERAAKVCDERAQECRDSFDSDRDERWLVYEKHAKRLAAAIRAGHSVTETPLGEG